jgi:chromosome segregation ATPase
MMRNEHDERRQWNELNRLRRETDNNEGRLYEAEREDRKAHQRIATLEAELAASREQSAQLAAALEPLLIAGQMLSNAAFNLSQGAELSPHVRGGLEKDYERWDKASKEVRTALAAWQQANK